MRRKKPTVAIVGSGNLGRVLALALRSAGYRVAEIVNRSAPSAQALARKVGAKALALDDRAPLTADVVWLCVTDDAIAAVSRSLAKSKTEWDGKIVVHTSGAYSSRELSALKRKGAATGSAHPMNSFVKTSRPDLRGVPFAIEGDAAAVRAAHNIAASLGGEVFAIRAKDKVAYHAMGAFTSPLLVSLLSTGERLGKAAGLSQPRSVMQRILRETIENFLKNGGEAAFSGPIKRGDIKTVSRHLRGVRRVPGALPIYQALALTAVGKLPGKNKPAMKKLLLRG